MQAIEMLEAKAQFLNLIEAAEQGEEIIILNQGKPAARLLSISSLPLKRQPGALKGKISMAEDFG